jgi:hypothetical protein
MASSSFQLCLGICSWRPYALEMRREGVITSIVVLINALCDKQLTTVTSRPDRSRLLVLVFLAPFSHLQASGRESWGWWLTAVGSWDSRRHRHHRRFLLLHIHYTCKRIFVGEFERFETKFIPVWIKVLLRPRLQLVQQNFTLISRF